MDHSSYDEFLSDFGDSLSQRELDALLQTARLRGDREMRLLVKQYLTLRAGVREVIKMIDRDVAVSTLHQSDPVRFLRFLVAEPSAATEGDSNEAT